MQETQSDDNNQEQDCEFTPFANARITVDCPTCSETHDIGDASEMRQIKTQQDCCMKCGHTYWFTA